ncbi:polysialic acid transport protein KpsM [Microbulbifer aestuariivivens]|uniref:Transport permease protein n=1 Tax=Microbulbifer aestuariivivens TaxID=1908308 RepID=A0ABP9WJR3_9GAMM
MFDGLWRYRGFILSMIKNEFRAKFVRSKLGGLWMILNPLSQVAIYALVLSNVLSAKLPGISNRYAYAVYLMAGLLSWTLFSEIVGRFLNLFVDQGNLMKKVSFPRITLPIVVVGSCLINNILLFFSILFALVVLNFDIGLNVFWILPLTLLVVTFSLGIGMLCAVINVFVRDVAQVIPVLLQIWFWLTPIVYPVNIIPKKYHDVMAMNPVAPLVGAYQDVIVHGKSVDIESLLPVLMLSITLVIFSFYIFRRASSEMVDVL